MGQELGPNQGKELETCPIKAPCASVTNFYILASPGTGGPQNAAKMPLTLNLTQQRKRAGNLLRPDMSSLYPPDLI